MGMIDSVESVFAKYFTISGRASRSEFWWFTLFSVLISLIAGFIDGVSGTVYSGLVITVVIFIPSITVTIRRLHDKDRSGWWLLIGLVPLIGLIVLIYWNVMRGTPGDNRFGPDPLAGR